MDVAAELVTLRGAAHRRDDAVADDEGTDVASLALGDELLDQHVLASALHRLDDRLGHLVVGREDHADALGALEQLDHDRRAADAVDGRQHVLPVADERRARHADVVARQDLDGAQLVARVGDPVRGVRRVDVHLLELADDGRTEVGDRCADPGHDRVVVGQRLATELEVRFGARQVDGEAQGVEHLALVAAIDRRQLESLGAVRPRCAGQDRELHAIPIVGSSCI